MTDRKKTRSDEDTALNSMGPRQPENVERGVGPRQPKKPENDEGKPSDTEKKDE